MTDPDTPRLSTLADDGWALSDVEERCERAAGIYWLPSRNERLHLEDHVPEGGYVKLVFIISAPDAENATISERMWVTLTGRTGEFYHGHLANEPKTPGPVYEDMPIWFRAEHVIDYAGPSGENRASESSETIACPQHGTSVACYVCEHLTPETAGRGFHTADPDTRRPDAWCSECHVEFERAGGWDAPDAKEPRLRLICGGCYDDLARRHGGRV